MASVRDKSTHVGKKFGKWTIIAPSEEGGRHYLCQCECGRKRGVRLDTLMSGSSVSCGCSQFERFSHLYKETTQRCPRCKQHLPLHAYTKFNQGKLGEPCRECNRKRGLKSREKLTKEEVRIRGLWHAHRLTAQEFYAMVKRQNSKCLGCLETLSIFDLFVDHDHETGKVRGLLCTHCNTALGHVKDKEEILYRLSAYLRYDREKLLIYTVGSLRNVKVTKIANKLRQNSNYDVFDDFMAAGPEADDFWKLYEKNRGRSFKEALKGRSAGHVFYYDKAYLDLADVVIVVLPAGKSCMLEAGYAKASGKRVYFLADGKVEKERYDVMKLFSDQVFFKFEDLVEAVEKDYQVLMPAIQAKGEAS